MSSFDKKIRVGARPSPLSRAQVNEVWQALSKFHPKVSFDPIWIETVGDRDLTTSLRSMERSNFFTKEIDEQLLQGCFSVAIHAAKDLPDWPQDLFQVVALTQGVDSSDVIVLRKEAANFSLCKGARIGTSSARREQNLLAWRQDLICADIRGSIERRLHQLECGDYDGVVMARAALIRLQLNDYPCIPLPGETANLQGQLAVVSRDRDEEMAALFSCIDVRSFCVR